MTLQYGILCVKVILKKQEQWLPLEKCVRRQTLRRTSRENNSPLYNNNSPLLSFQLSGQCVRLTDESDAEASFLDLHLSISDGFVKTKIYNKRDYFDFEVVNFPFLDGDVPRSASYGVYISQLIRFARISSHVDDFNTRNKVLTAKLQTILNLT